MAIRAEGIRLLGQQTNFYVKAVASVPFTLRRYRVETARVLTDITWGSGGLIVGGGTMGVIFVLAIVAGATVGLQGYLGLDVLGMAPLVGFVSAFANTREIAPLVCAAAFAAQAGCRYTAQLGSMRIGEEIDALEVMAVRPVPYLVTTRMIAGFVAIIPLYLVALVISFATTQFLITFVYSQSVGSYEHYFFTYFQPRDVFLSVVKVTVFVLLATMIHCYYGFHAKGGPEGVGQASGRAIRNTLITIVVANMLMTLLFWGFDPGIRISG
ncbi:MAG TPA: ABC transporter permease [Nocardioidaceae bacterium]|nr:ABC transporter permease [Nocardioidaceae bacterium]